MRIMFAPRRRIRHKAQGSRINSITANMRLIYCASKMIVEPLIRVWHICIRCESHRMPPFHDYGQPTQGGPSAAEHRSTANRRPCRAFSPYHPAHGSKRRRRPRQRRFSDEAGFRTGKCGDRINQSGCCELSRRSRRSSQGARYEAKDEEREAVQSFVSADFGTDQVTTVVLGKRISRWRRALRCRSKYRTTPRCGRRPDFGPISIKRRLKVADTSAGVCRRREAIGNQYAASVAACAFAPKPATQTLISADHSMGAAAWGPKCKSIATRRPGGSCRAYDAHPIDAKKRQMASVPDSRSGSEDDMSCEA